MVQRTFVLLGMAILLSLLFPLKAALRESGVDPLALPLTGVDLAGLGVLLGVLPSLALYRHAQLGQRLVSWNLWLALLVVFSALFLLLHVSWSREFVSAYLQQELAPNGSLPLAISHHLVIKGAELASQLGVLVCVVGVLVNLHSIAEEPEPPRRRKK
jgi:hypothetical protein